ncbi:phosphate-starvation-inducible protein PsiE [Paraburkholderia youngii]|uniref:Protein PsiE n=1 Tax=Paraburkholderia youngii TaxID=2782701 RepID=A0A7Y6K2P9_9BURK|nr:phosphate-starvation-inducible PsiE family protein [Paraburkholderia youngii]NUY02415.1 phosphate-starvation-inducible PsiE family protein [Paraburkholderia youngii]
MTVTKNRHYLIESAAESVRRRFGGFLCVIELLGLVIIGLATAYAIGQEAWKIIRAGDVSLTDLLLMFLYLEVLAMDVRYLRLGQLPVRFPLYIAMASLARDLILRGMADGWQQLLTTTAGIALVAASVLILHVEQQRATAAGGNSQPEAERREH